MDFNIKWVGCAAGNYGPGRGGMKPEAIVIHIMDGTLVGTDTWFNTPPEKRGNPAVIPRPGASQGSLASSAGYGVGKDGTIHQYVKDEDRAYHAGRVLSPSWRGLSLHPKVNPNAWTLSIEHEGMASDVGPWPEPQMQASAWLMAQLAAKWTIPLDRMHVCGHHEIFRDKPCPGPNCDLDRLISMALLVK